MQDIEKLKNWIAEKSFHTQNCKNQELEIGTFDFGLCYLKNNQNPSNPLCLSQIQSQIDKNSTIKFNILGEQFDNVKVQFIKRIQNTPFYYSLISGDKFSVKVIDFSDWESSVIYRILIIQTLKNICDVEILCSEVSENYVIKINDIYFHSSEIIKTIPNENKLTINARLNEQNEAVVVFAFAKNKEIEGDLSLASVYKLLKKLEDKCRENHLSNYFITKNSDAEHKLDILWNSQKYLLPDRRPNPLFLNDIVKYSVEIHWIVELYLYFGLRDDLTHIFKSLKSTLSSDNISWRLLFIIFQIESYLKIKENERISTKLFSQMMKKRIEEDYTFKSLCINIIDLNQRRDINESDCTDEEIFCSAFFSDVVNDSELTQRLQKWWDINSLPLFSQKIDKSIKQAEETIFIIYLLSLRKYLPWSESLYNLYVKNYNNQFIHLFSFIYKRLILKYGLNQQLNIYPGQFWDNNFKSVSTSQNDFLISFTKYSKKSYLSLRDKHNQILKIDKEVCSIYKEEKNEYIIKPAVPYFSSELEISKTLKIAVNGKILLLPLLWKKAEIVFCKIKIRWILKKRRFQITVLTKDPKDVIFFNDYRIDSSKINRHIYYIDIEYRKPKIELYILDSIGRNLHLRQRNAKRDILASGWGMDKHGVFVQNINYQYFKRQHPVSINDTGLINKNLSIPNNVSAIKILIKQFKEEMPLRYFNDISIENLSRFSPQVWQGGLIVVLEPELKDQLNFIRSKFESTLGFSPEITFNESLIEKPNWLQIIKISQSSDSIRLVTHKVKDNFMYLEIGAKTGLKNLNQFSSFFNQNVSAKNLEI